MIYKKFIVSKDEIWQIHNKMQDADFSRHLKTDRIAAHWVVLPPADTSSMPHAESHEEEFIYIVSGDPHIWINGYIYQLHAGMCVGFKAGTGVSHTVINNTNQNVEMIVLGERTKKHNKCAFPINPELKKESEAIWWNDAPVHELGPHDGKAGNLLHRKDISEMSIIKDVNLLKREGSFSYHEDTETFSEGVRLSNHVDLKKLGVWSEYVPVGKRTSFPHSHSIEEELAIVTKGHLQVWLNGELYDLKTGDAVYFKPGTNISHVIINNSDEEAEYIMLGESELENEQKDLINYPLNQTRNDQCFSKGNFWSYAPTEPIIQKNLSVPILKNLKFVIEKDVNSFLKSSSEFLYKREAEYNLFLGLSFAQQKLEKNEYTYINIYQNNLLIGCAINTDKNFILTNIPEPILYKLVEFVTEKIIIFTGVVGPSMSSELFARIYCDFTSRKHKLGFAQKIYQNEKVIYPQVVPGCLQIADESHTELVAKWIAEFKAEAIPNEQDTPDKTLQLAASKIKNGEAFLWFNENKSPVSMNFVGRPTKNGIGVNAVYTPKALRKKGYASVLVAATTQKMLDQGLKFCVLYTDLSNPTSNKIYQDIGYTEVAGSKQYLIMS